MIAFHHSLKDNSTIYFTYSNPNKMSTETEVIRRIFKPRFVKSATMTGMDDVLRHCKRLRPIKPRVIRIDRGPNDTVIDAIKMFIMELGTHIITGEDQYGEPMIKETENLLLYMASCGVVLIHDGDEIVDRDTIKDLMWTSLDPENIFAVGDDIVGVLRIPFMEIAKALQAEEIRQKEEEEEWFRKKDEEMRSKKEKRVAEAGRSHT